MASVRHHFGDLFKDNLRIKWLKYLYLLRGKGILFGMAIGDSRGEKMASVRRCFRDVFKDIILKIVDNLVNNKLKVLF